MVCIVLTPLSVIPLVVWIDWLSRPSNGVAHVLYDGNYFYGLYIEIVLRQPGVVNWCCRMIVRPSHLTAKWTSGISCRSPLWCGVGVRITSICTSFCWLEGSFRTSFLATTLIIWAPNTMKLIPLPSNLNPSSGQGIFHGGAVELDQLFIKLTVREESLSEGIGGSLLMAEGDGHLLSV